MIRKIERIPKDPLDGQIKGVSQDVILNNEYEKLKVENLKMKGSLDELSAIKERMSNIIEICEINSHQNEKWIIGLNKLLSNFDKMIHIENQNIVNGHKACKEMERVKEEFIGEFLTMAKKKKDYADYINSSLEAQKIISSQIKNTDYLIQSTLLLEQQKFEQKAKEERNLEDEQLKQYALDQRKKHLNDELSKLQKNYDNFKATMLTEGNTLENFERSKAFKKLLNDLDQKKDLERAIYENKLQIQMLQEKVETLLTQKETLELATIQKGNALDYQEEEPPETYTSLRGLKEEVAHINSQIDEKKIGDAKTQQMLSGVMVEIS
jgi:hypothetical protein